MSAEHMRGAYARLTQSFSLATIPSVQARILRLTALKAALGTFQARIVAAAQQDFARRSEVETLMAEIMPLGEAISHTVRHLKRWTRPQTSYRLKPIPGRAELWTEPKGVVGILAPWNYPFYLSLMPAIAAVAAGNKVIIKPSERAPESARVLAELVSTVFPTDDVVVVEGAAETAKTLASLPLGHLFFTGSTATGRRVAAAAAQTLTPVTLELGGRCPAIALEGTEPERHAGMIGYGAWLNGGQTCIAPNHLWVPAGTAHHWAEALLAVAKRFMPNDSTALIDENAQARLADMLAHTDAEHTLAIEESNSAAPRVVINPAPDSPLMTQEIFGPVLPIRTYSDIAEVITAERGSNPLAAYVFGPDKARARAVLTDIRSGGAAINATIFHIALPDMPFGGIGASGMGAYHGRRGFDEFSHQRTVFTAVSGPWTNLILPPYSARIKQLLRRIAR
ncbi:MAG: aldehyde dehydrogenase family protein [Pseudomonadota bacterium]